MIRLSMILALCVGLMGCSGGSEEEAQTTDETATVSSGGETTTDADEAMDEATEPRPFDQPDAQETPAP